MKCRSAQRALRLQLDDSLALERELALEHHLADCASCRSRAMQMQALEEALVRLPQPPVERLDVERAVAQVRARCEVAPVEPVERGHLLRQGAIVLAAAAAGLLLWTALREGEARETVRTPSEQLVTERRVTPEDGPDLRPTEPSPLNTSTAAEFVPLDTHRLAAAREEVRTALRELGTGIGLDASREEVLALAELFDLNTLALRRGDWPVRSIVEGMLTSDELGIARAAARYLGVRAGSSSARRLRAVLEHEELSSSIVLALVDLGAGGQEGLADALELPAVRDVALGGLVQLATPTAAAHLGSALESTATGDASWSQALLDGLAQMGTVGLPELLQLHANETLDDETWLAALQDVQGASEWFARRLGQGQLSKPRTSLIATRALAPDETLTWLEAHLYERAYQELSREFLPTLAGERVVTILARLHEDSRLASDDLAAMLKAALETDTQRFVRALQTRSSVSTSQRQTLLEMLLALSEPDLAIPALMAAVGASDLSESARSEAALHIGESSTDGALPALTAAFADCTLSERKLAAACLLGIVRIGGLEAVASALDGGPRRTTQNIRSLLQRREAEERLIPSIYKLSRELKPFLSARDRETRRTSS